MEKLPHEDHLRRLVRRILSDQQLIDDVLQDTYIAAWRKAIAPTDENRGWLVTTARNFAFMALRSRERRSKHEGKTRDTRISSVVDLLSRRELRARVEAAIASLDPKFGEAVRLRYIDDLPFADVGERLLISTEAARTRVRRGLAQLEHKLHAENGRPDAPSLIPGLLGLGGTLAPTPQRRPFFASFALPVLLVATLVAVVLLIWRASTDPERSSTTVSGGPAADVTDAGTTPPARTTNPGAPVAPPAVIRGVVRVDGSPSDAARIEVFSMPDRAAAGSQSALAATNTDTDGTFQVEIERRTRVTVHVSAKGCATTSRLLSIPAIGNPDDVTFELEPAYVITATVQRADGTPVEGATVIARQGVPQKHVVSRKQVSDANGHVRFELREPNYYEPLSFHVHATGFATLEQDERSPLIEHGVPVHAWLTLESGAQLKGRTRAPDGTPLGGVTVRIQMHASAGTRCSAETMSDDSGAYAFANLPPFAVTSVEATPPPSSSFGPNYSLCIVRLSNTKTPTLDVSVAATQDFTGSVVDASDQPVRGARVTLLRHAGREFVVADRVTADADGAFRFARLTAGAYAIEAGAKGLARRIARHRGAPDFTVKKTPIEHQIVRVETCSSLLVRMSVPDGTPLYGRSSDDPAELPIRVHGKGLDRVVWVTWGGSIEVFDLPVDRKLAVGPMPRSQYDPLGFTLGTTSVTVRKDKRAECTLTMGKIETLIDVLVLDHDGRPVRDATVDMFEASTSMRNLRLLESRTPRGFAMRTNRNGRCVIPVLSRRFERCRNGWIIAARHFDHVRGETRGESLAAGGRQAVTVQLPRGETIVGTVVGPDGSPYSNAAITWVRAEDGLITVFLGGALSAADGTFRMNGMAPGTYRLLARTQTLSSVSTEIQKGQPVRLQLAPVRTILLTGTVRDAEGKPIADAKVLVFHDDIGHDRRADGRCLTRADGSWFVRVPKRPSYVINVTHLSKGERLENKFGAIVPGDGHIDLKVTESADVVGRVLGANGRPVAAHIAARHKRISDGLPPIETDSAGRFEIKDMPLGFHKLIVVASGHVPQVIDRGPTGRTVRVQLRKGASISGTLTRDGQPQPNVSLRIVPAEQATAKAEETWQINMGSAVPELLDLCRTIKTDSHGKFTFTGLTEGKWSIVPVDTHANLTIAPQPVAAGAFASLELVPSIQVTANIKFDGDIGPQQSIWVIQTFVNGVRYSRSVWPRKKKFTFQLPPGKITIRIVGVGMDSKDTELTATRDTEVKIELRESK